MRKSVAIVNRKGGVGKTTLAVILAEQALLKGVTAVCVDLDPQENFIDSLSFFAGRKENERYLDKLIPCGIHDKVEIPDDGDILIVIDCPPALEDATMKGMKLADKILVPVMSDIFSILNLEVVFKQAEDCGKSRNDISLVTIGYKQGGATLPSSIRSNIDKRNYKVAAELPVHKTIAVNIASGKKWSNGIDMKFRRPFFELYNDLTA
ncbi:hypothetical protein AGMMS50276_28790 [Synergistales bacterium]|nr:hypothetical protein AGMMS50276_28790 [Synergistales bacterium]